MSIGPGKPCGDGETPTGGSGAGRARYPVVVA
jgi:hypothetical protein